jgi:hypothetical protein
MSNAPAAAWYPDPEDATQLRYWDGEQWTEHRAPAQPQQPVQQEPRQDPPIFCLDPA